MTRSLLLSICNVYAKGDFTADVTVGDQAKTLRLILDTGSSTLVVNSSALNEEAFESTQLAQHISYGAGSWLGPVIKTQLKLGKQLGVHQSLVVKSVHMALAHHIQDHAFIHADGILGLAYKQLNKAHDLSALCEQYRVHPEATYPWPAIFAQQPLAEFEKILSESPQRLVTPYFDELATHNVVADSFAMVVHRSSIYQGVTGASQETLASHPLNRGILILGNPKIHEHMHNNDFISVKVVHDKYYNVHILSVRLEGMPAIPFPKLDSHHVKAYVSNGIVDSGASAIVFPGSVYTALLRQFKEHNQQFASLLEPFTIFSGEERGIPLEKLDFEQWPALLIEVETSAGETAVLQVSPHTYWQTHAPETGQVSFKLTTLPDWPNQGILGLPLMNNYYTIFNRAHGTTGEIEFASKSFAPHLLHDDYHQDLQQSQLHFDEHGHLI